MSNDNNIYKNWHFFWLERVRLFPEVLQNPALEDAFKSFGEKVYDEGFKDGHKAGRIMGNEEADEEEYEIGYDNGVYDTERKYENKKD